MLTCPEAERSVLGSLLLVGQGTLPPTLSQEHFYAHKHSYLYMVIQELHTEDRGFDVPCVLRAMVARLPKMTETALTERHRKIRTELDLLVGEGQVSMLKDHARLVVEASCFRSLKATSLEMQDAALRGDVGAFGRALSAARESYGLLVKLGSGPVLEVVRDEEAA